MFVTNIPRRKIYEKMLEFEEHVLEIQILARDQDTFDKFKDKYPETLKNAMIKYTEIKALLVMFLDNMKFDSEDEFNSSLTYFLVNDKETNLKLKKNKNIKNKFDLIVKLDEILKTNQKLENYSQSKDIFEKLDAFNSAIPLILEMRRDEM